jgi:hypothetical protein
VTLSASSEFIWIPGETNLEAGLLNHSKSVNLSTVSETFLVQIWSNK